MKLYKKLAAEYGMLGVQVPEKRAAKEAGLAVPRWVKNGPLYEIFIRAFTAEGTFKAAGNQLPRLREMGVSSLWLMPFHPTGISGRKGSLGSPYSIRDYLAVDPACGTFEDFRQFVNRAHELGMKVIMDLVFNHCAIDHPMRMTNPDRFVNDNGVPQRKIAEWTDVGDWDFDNPQTKGYLSDVARFWLREGGVDGFRCDVAGMVPLAFWEKLTEELLWIYPQLFMLAEWEDARLYKKAFHGGYDWTLYRLMLQVAEQKRPASDIGKLVNEKIAVMPRNTLELRFTENHDMPRAVKAFGKQGAQFFTALTFFLPGLPLLYAGQETGTGASPSLFEQTPVNWGNSKSLFRESEFFQNLIGIRRQFPDLADADFETVKTENHTDVLAFTRHSPKMHLLCIFNCGMKDADFRANAVGKIALKAQEGKVVDLMDQNKMIWEMNHA